MGYLLAMTVREEEAQTEKTAMSFKGPEARMHWACVFFFFNKFI